MTTPEVEILTHHNTELGAVFFEVGTGYDETAGDNHVFTLSDFDHDESIQFSGSGFKYKSDGTPKSGTVTSISIQAGDHDYAQITNISESLEKIFAILSSGHPERLYDLFGDTGFTGNSGNDFILTGNGADHIRSFGGDDAIAAGAGGDYMDGGKGSDTADYSTAKTIGVIAGLANSASNSNDAAGDTYISIENLIGSNYRDVLSGDDHANVIDGGGGPDVLYGGRGQDTLRGSLGADEIFGGKGGDQLFGGLGDDHFTYIRSDISANDPDHIRDWNDGDLIAVDAASFGHGLVVGQPLTHAQFHLDGAVGHNAQFVYVSSTGNLFWDADGDGSDFGVIVATLNGAPAIDRHDILVISGDG